MSEPAKPLSEGDIEACNVLPAFEASLVCGASESELAGLGWTREVLTAPGARVTGESTYAHMELMYEKPAYADFALDAASRHGASSLGVVGLLAKTAPTVGSALAYHARFQQLTNRTAKYSTEVRGKELVVREHRPGEPRLGNRLISDYAMLVTISLLRLVSASPPVIREVRSRRSEIPLGERRRYEDFFGVRLRLGASRAGLSLDARLMHTPTVAADAELERWFRTHLERSRLDSADDPPMSRDVRARVRRALTVGSPSVESIAKQMGLGSRTLQRRLAAEGTSFAEIVDSTRRSLTEHYLADPSLSLAEIAYLLGYREQASFYRAFRRWYRTTPEAFRRSIERSKEESTTVSGVVVESTTVAHGREAADDPPG